MTISRSTLGVRARFARSLALLAAAVGGCNLVLDSSSYRVGSGGDSSVGVDPAGMVAPDGNLAETASGPSDACVGSNRATLETACTNSECVPFTRVVPSCDGEPCPLPSSMDGSSGDAIASDSMMSNRPAAGGDADSLSDAGPPTDGSGASPPAHADANEGGAVDATAVSSKGVEAGEKTASPVSLIRDGGPDAAESGATAPVDDASIAGIDAGATNPCAAVRPDPSTIIFVTGSTALASFINEVSKVLATPPNSTTVVYQQSGSCVGVAAAIDPTNTRMVPALGAATYYDATGTQRNCDLDPQSGVVADIGASDVFYSTCYLGQPAIPALPQSVAENFGPVQVMNLAVPQASTQKSISLRAAYYVFGFGGATYGVAPWLDPAQLQIRSATSGTQAMIAAAIGVPPALWRGVNNATSALVGQALVSAGQNKSSSVVDSALGILASDYLIHNANTLRGLAVQDHNAGCGFYPNSTATSRDAANVRDGHYPLWGPSHFYARVDSQTRLPLKRGTSQFIDALSGVTSLSGLDLVGEYASSGLVPTCAMHVSRTNDGGDYTPYKPPLTCNCYFDRMATGATNCARCSTNADCPTATPICNKFGLPPQQGYCDL